MKPNTRHPIKKNKMNPINQPPRFQYGAPAGEVTECPEDDPQQH
jgi:hypothetical protein